MVTGVPPPVGPLLGLTAVTVGMAKKVNWSAGDVAEVPPVVVIVTSTVPGEGEGVTAVVCVGELTVTLAAAAKPKAPLAPAMKLVPVIVTDVPPPVGPELGDSDVTAGCTAL